MAPAQDLPSDLSYYLLAHAAVSARDEDATRQALRGAAETLTNAQGHKVAAQLFRSLSPDGRRWLQTSMQY